jgi:uncharacterized Tic20 family protein
VLPERHTLLLMSIPSSAPGATARSTHDERLWASFAHFGGLLGFVPSLVIYLVLKERSAVIRREAKEALNWQITFTVGYLVVLLVVTIVAALLSLASLAGAASVLTALPFVLYVANVVFSILGGLRVNAGGSYRYPFSVRLLR